MQRKRIPNQRFENSPGSAEEDDRTQEAVLGHLLHLYPGQLTTDEVVRELTNDSEEFAEVDACNRAIRDLIATGLLHRHGEFLVPSRAAVRGEEIGL